MNTSPVASVADAISVGKDAPVREQAPAIAQYQAALTAAAQSVRCAQAALATAAELLQARLGSMPVIEQAKDHRDGTTAVRARRGVRLASPRIPAPSPPPIP